MDKHVHRCIGPDSFFSGLSWKEHVFRIGITQHPSRHHFNRRNHIGHCFKHDVVQVENGWVLRIFLLKSILFSMHICLPIWKGWWNLSKGIGWNLLGNLQPYGRVFQNSWNWKILLKRKYLVVTGALTYNEKLII